LAFQPDLIVRRQRVVTPNGIRPAAVHIRGEKIVGVLEFSDVLAGCPLDDAGQAAVIPGVVDTHVHVNDSDSLRGERLEMTTRAAAAGGITALMEMRLNSMVTPTGPSPLLATTAENVAAIRNAVDGHCYVDVGLWGSAVPGNARELMPMLDAGAFGFRRQVRAGRATRTGSGGNAAYCSALRSVGSRPCAGQDRVVAVRLSDPILGP
jgi:allantoinase